MAVNSTECAAKKDAISPSEWSLQSRELITGLSGFYCYKTLNHGCYELHHMGYYISDEKFEQMISRIDSMAMLYLFCKDLPFAHVFFI